MIGDACGVGGAIVDIWEAAWSTVAISLRGLNDGSWVGSTVSAIIVVSVIDTLQYNKKLRFSYLNS